MTKNLEAYVRLDKTGLEDKYVVIVNDEVVTKGEEVENVLERVRQDYPNEIPFVAKVPDERMMIL
jgi:hypothetical protein